MNVNDSVSFSNNGLRRQGVVTDIRNDPYGEAVFTVSVQRDYYGSTTFRSYFLAESSLTAAAFQSTLN